MTSRCCTLRCSMASVKLANYTVPTISSSGLANIMHFKNSQVPLPHPVVLQKKNVRRVNGFFNLPNPSSRTIALGSTQPLTEMSTRSLTGGKSRPALKADNLTDICEPAV
jgi:hypothetical protein